MKKNCREYTATGANKEGNSHLSNTARKTLGHGERQSGGFTWGAVRKALNISDRRVASI